MTRVPFTLAAAHDQDSWRSGFRWPIGYADLRAIPNGLTGLMLDCARDLADERARATAMLAILRAGIAVREAGFVAWHASAAREAGMELVGLLDTEAGNQAAAGAAATSGFDHALAWPLLRRIARAASWNRGPMSLGRAFLAPDAVAVSHNPLLRATAKGSGQAIGFRNADVMAAEATRRGRTDAARVAAVTDGFTRFFERFPVRAQCMERLYRNVRRRVETVVEQADRLLDGLRSISLPPAVWSGSTGYFPVRAVMIEARRRGHATTVFDHGGSSTFIDEPDLLFMIDRHAADRLILPTENAAVLASGAAPPGVFRGLSPCRLEGAAGDPVFRDAALLPPRTPRSRPRVLYVPTLFNGGRPNLPPLLPDPVHLFHQRAVIEAFDGAPAELVLKPHPGGALRGKPHPLEGMVEIDTRPFIEALADADVVINDYPQSTAFWEACCSDRRVVILDLGIVRFHPAGRAIIEQRCEIVPVGWSADNLPVFDPKVLVDAALAGRPLDPTAMRQILVGPMN